MECVLDVLALGKWEPEFQFHERRKWRFDYIAKGVGIEIEGGIWMQGRHTRGKGFQNDLDKYNEAAALGYRVFRFSTADVLKGRAAEMLRRVL